MRPAPGRAEPAMQAITLDAPWLHVDLGRIHRILSWAINRPGFTEARHILWRQVRNADLPPGLDVRGWLSAEIARRGHPDAIALLTSRNLARYTVAEAEVETIHACCLVTLGLSNGERIGHRRAGALAGHGTINLALIVSAPLTDAALVEALSIAAQARTAAVLDAAVLLPAGPVTGTGTDCIAVAAPVAPGPALPYAGLHTAVGEAVGRACYDAVAIAAAEWRSENGGALNPEDRPA